MEKTINLLRQEAIIHADKVTELQKQINENAIQTNKKLDRLELFNEEVKIQIDEITDCVTILTNRRTQKLEKDCERRLKRKLEIQTTLSTEKKKLHRSN